MHLAGGYRELERFAVGVRHHQDCAGARVLRDHGDDTVALLEVEHLPVEHDRFRNPVLDGRGLGHSRPSFGTYDPLTVPCTRICRTSSERHALVAIMSPPIAVSAPVQSVSTPPASSIIGSMGAASQAETTSSTMTSARPVATSI